MGTEPLLYSIYVMFAGFDRDWDDDTFVGGELEARHTRKTPQNVFY